jgi:hypothetical protein
VIQIVHQHILPAAYSLLPPQMQSPAATAMLLAIGLQESKFQYRRQVGGPARGFWQFEEEGGVAGVLRHPTTAVAAQAVLRGLQYRTQYTPAGVYALLADNDVLAAAFARLLLWTVPHHLPTQFEPKAAWEYYLDGWRPGKPHPATWAAYYASAWQRVRDLEVLT